MNYKDAKILTPAEAKRLEQYVEKQGGQMQVAVLLGVSITTLSRTANMHTAPSRDLRKKLTKVGVLEKA